MNHVMALWNRVLSGARRVEWMGPLIARISVGAMFAQSGWGKLNNLANTASFFTSLGIPAPGFHAVLVSCVEFLGGLAIVLGLATRLWAVPLAATMAVAMISGGAFNDPPEGVLDYVTASEFTYLAVMVWLAVVGAGKASVDAVVARATRVRPG
jgi:putative oxidoreductase